MLYLFYTKTEKTECLRYCLICLSASYFKEWLLTFNISALFCISWIVPFEYFPKISYFLSWASAFCLLNISTTAKLLKNIQAHRTKMTKNEWDRCKWTTPKEDCPAHAELLSHVLTGCQQTRKATNILLVAVQLHWATFKIFMSWYYSMISNAFHYNILTVGKQEGNVYICQVFEKTLIVQHFFFFCHWGKMLNMSFTEVDIFTFCSTFLNIFVLEEKCWIIILQESIFFPFV